MISKILCAALALWFIAPWAGAAEVGSDGQPLNGMAPLYAPFSSSQRRTIEARLTLPEEKTNKDWYANWVMIVGSTPASKHQVFVQVGAIRRPGVYKGARVFIATQDIYDSKIRYFEFGALTEGEHTFAIVGRGARYTMFADGKQVGIPLIIAFVHAYAEVGPEVYAQGDRLVGDVRAVVAHSGESRIALQGGDVCRYLNHGAELVFDRGVYHAHGMFDRKKASRFEGNCAGI